MPQTGRPRFTLLAVLLAMVALVGGRSYGQTPKYNRELTPDEIKMIKGSVPDPYRRLGEFGTLPAGRKWGAPSQVDFDPDGKSIWVAERCGGDAFGCAGSPLDPILKFDASGKLLKSFGKGMFVFPHGLHVDKDGNVWVTDGNGKDGKGHQVFKFSPDGKLLMTLGTAGVAGNGSDTFNQPTDVVVAANGDIFVADGHTPVKTPRIVKFSKDGKFIKSFGTYGKGPGEIIDPHCLEIDYRGRLFVCDRGNIRVQIFDQEGQSLGMWTHLGRVGGLFLSKDDKVYASNQDLGIIVANAKDGSILSWIRVPVNPDPEARTRASESVALDASATTMFTGEIGEVRLIKYVKK
jgi:hypothetical protein